MSQRTDDLYKRCSKCGQSNSKHTIGRGEPGGCPRVTDEEIADILRGAREEIVTHPDGSKSIHVTIERSALDRLHDRCREDLGGAVSVSSVMLMYLIQVYRTYRPRLVRAIEELQRRVAERQAFKDFVHRRLDEAGIPTHPDGPHSKEGCRIGDRLDLVLEPPVIDRDEIARVLEIVADDGLPEPRDIDVATDAILAACFEGRIPT